MSEKEDVAFVICVEKGVIVQCPKCAHIVFVVHDNSSAAYAYATYLWTNKDPRVKCYSSRTDLTDHIKKAIEDADKVPDNCTCGSRFNPMK